MENEPDIFWDLPDEFQSLIGTVQRKKDITQKTDC